jgi:hypothetical protein
MIKLTVGKAETNGNRGDEVGENGGGKGGEGVESEGGGGSLEKHKWRAAEGPWRWCGDRC